MATQPARHVSGQDPARVDSRHYTIELETEKVRVLRARYGPHEKSEMHFHPATIGIMVTNADIRFTYPDGRTETMTAKPGQVMEIPATEHLPENLSNQVFEAILVELKV